MIRFIIYNINKVFNMTPFDLQLILSVMLIQTCCGVNWDKMKCSMDRVPVAAGLLPPEQIGRFPWMGIIQHDFYSADRMRYSITGAVLIHPEYVIASAEDMAKIDKDILRNSTNFIAWYSAAVKYTMAVTDYHLNKEYETVTYATTALVKIMRDSAIELGNPGPIMQICMPIKESSTFGNIYAIKITDDTGEFQKEVITMDIVSSKDCDLYDDKAEGDMKMIVPTHPICASAQGVQLTCFIDSGAVLVSRESETYWTLLGFGVRGPTCAAPARFIYLMGQMEWIESQISA